MRACLFAFLFVMASTAVLAADKPEPKYEGKPLNYWLLRFQKAETNGQRTAAVEALQAFGPDAEPALPTLIEMLADHSPSFRAHVVTIIAAIGPKAKDARPIIAKRLKETQKNDYIGYNDAVSAMLAISPTPKDAVPDLIPLLGKNDWGFAVFNTLCSIGPDAKEAIPAIRRYVLDIIAENAKEIPRTTLSSLACLDKLGPDIVPLLLELLEAHCGYARYVAFHCLSQLGEKAKKASPTLLNLLKHDDPSWQFHAATALWSIEKNPAAISTLIGLLKVDPNLTYSLFDGTDEQSIVTAAAGMLGEIGPEAKEALPALKVLATKKEDPKTTYIPDVLPLVPSRSEAGEAAKIAIRKIEQKQKK